VVEPLVNKPDGSVEPGPDESWQGLADHSVEHDDLPALAA
jgi:hypothetical protein